MSLPLGQFLPEADVNVYLPPWDEDYDPLNEAITGGTALGDGAAGRQVQRWTGFLDDDGNIKAANEAGAVAVSITPVATPVQTVSVGFDSNMAVAFAYTTPVGSHLYYFNSLLGAYDTLTVVGASSSRVCADDPRLFNNAVSDVIFAYTLDGVLYYRQQRDRYLIEYTVGPVVGDNILLRVGPNVHFRLQFKLGQYNPPT